MDASDFFGGARGPAGRATARPGTALELEHPARGEPGQHALERRGMSEKYTTTPTPIQPMTIQIRRSRARAADGVMEVWRERLR